MKPNRKILTCLNKQRELSVLDIRAYKISLYKNFALKITFQGKIEMLGEYFAFISEYNKGTTICNEACTKINT